MSDSAQAADLAYAVEQFRQGLPADAIAERLAERGLPDHAIRGVLTELLVGLEDDVCQALQAGLLPQQVVRQLRDWGLEQELDWEVVNSGRAKSPVSRPRPSDGNSGMMWWGAVVFTVGLLLIFVGAVVPGLDFVGGLGVPATGIGGLLWKLGRPR